MRRLQFAMIALVATAVGASVCAAPSLAKPPAKKHMSSKKSSMSKKAAPKKVASRSRRDRRGCPPRPRKRPHTMGSTPRPPQA